ncbi:hypothetical protein GV791_04530 [Nocardia cyriacigeorgica]|uniref:Uncharacterized protein n=1 Tax=Nocardia cyriacigeorgica TaxID=135487 RepID=A0A6P1CHF8_9NOCA|nr:hypothetical protein [Nocardia cyriacigeorgica]MBF6083489.1 hypothetical protein [Nocardia cyriacigeorgica]MBF6287032.1 hypothetical protein [Nocardia cyriacigeorgica]NEW31828.1 hypothetical protein [Nocardia cyriacigeorgica]
MASTSLPLATAAAVATLFASPAGAVPNDQPEAPAPTQDESPSQPGTTQPEQSQSPTQPGVTDPAKPENPQGNATPSQPGVTTPNTDNDQKDPKLAAPRQPGVTAPRVAPLPVPGQSGPVQPVVVPDQKPGETDPNRPGVIDPRTEGVVTPEDGSEAQPAIDGETAEAIQPGTESETQTLVQPSWEAPRIEAAPAAPVVEMTGPHAEVGATIDGGSLLPGHLANTHHFTNEAGYVGTIGYSTPTGRGDAGIAWEFLDENHIKVNTFTGGAGLADNKFETVLDTTQLNAAKATVEQWIAQQPGGAAALEAAAQVKLPTIVQPGDMAPQTINVAGVTTQWGGSLQY